jgi:hypothetical protein
MAVDYYGNAIRFRHGHWGAPHNLMPESTYGEQRMWDVSCASAAFCVALSWYGLVLTYDHGSWSEPQQVTWRNLDSVSCTSRTFCMAVSNSLGASLRYDGSAWSEVAMPGSVRVNTVACASPTFCVAAGWGNVYTYDGDSWSDPQQVARVAQDQVSCSSAHFCALVSLRGFYSMWDGSTWSTERHIHGVDKNRKDGVWGLSCPVDGMCMAVVGYHYAFHYVDGDWTKSRALNPRGGEFKDVSCATSTFCTAVDETGNALSYRG